MPQEATAQNLVAQGNQVLYAFRRALGALAQRLDDSRTSSPVEATFKAEFQRFQLWAINLGLFQASHNSLEYRLRQNATVRSLIAALLTDLCLALDDLVDELFRETNDKNDDTEELEAKVHSGVRASLDAESFLSVNRSKVSDSSGDLVDEEDLMTMYTDDVIEINDELMKIAMQIRSPNSRQPRHKTYSSGKIDHDEQDVYKSVLMSFRQKGIEQTMISARLRRLSIDQAATTPVLRGSDDFLVDRLSKANEFRRQQFDYWRRFRSHSIRATTNAAVAADANYSHDKVQPRAVLTPTADVVFDRSDQKAPKTVSMPSVSLLAPDFKLRSVRSARTHQSRALTVHTPGGDLIAWPEVPSSVPIGKEFECPLCFFICPQEQRSGEPWRVHLKHDLCPYLCTFPNCSQPDTLYESRDQWIQHEQWNHMCFWRCPKDEIEFENLSAYEDHIITQHPAATAAGNKLLSDGVLETQRFLTEQPSRSCLFCDVDLEGFEEMYDHIGGHLETVAMLAIPTLDDRDLQSNPDAASSEAAGRDVDGSRKNDFETALPVLFPENDHPDHQPPAEQLMSGSNFERLLAGLPHQEALDTSAWTITVNPTDNATSEPSSDTIRNDSQTIKEDLSIQQEQTRLLHRTVTTWISPIDFAELQAKIIGTRQEGTGVWFTNSKLFLGWLHGPNQTLFCLGAPGAGKTMIAAIVVDYLREIQSKEIGVAYVYAHHQKRADRSVSKIAAIILRQLIQDQNSTPETVANLYTRYAGRSDRPSSEEIINALKVVLSNYTKVYLVVDALDRCYQSYDDDASHFLLTLRQLQSTGRLHLLVTSRPEGEVLDHCGLAPTLRIASQLPTLANKVLSWTTCAQRALSTTELCHALAVEPGDTRLDAESIPYLENILSVCAGLIRLDKESNSIKAGHSTTLEYLESIGQSWAPGAQVYIASVCLSYLSFDVFASGPCRTTEDLDIRIAKHPFYKYAALNWAAHSSTVQAEISHLALPFLQHSFLVASASQMLSDQNKFLKGSTGLHLTASFGLLFLTEQLLRAAGGAASEFVDSRNGARWTPLALAAANGHVGVVALLMARNDVDTDIDTTRGRTPLSLAAEKGHEEVVTLLLARKDTDADAIDIHGRAPLWFAAANGHVGVVKLLLARNDVDPNARDKEHPTYLSLAAQRGDEEVVKLLLARKDIEPDAKDVYGQTPLFFAAERGNETVVKMLLTRDDVDIEAKDHQGRTPLSFETVVKLLLARNDLDIEGKDNEGRTPLSLAATYGGSRMAEAIQSWTTTGRRS